MQRFTFVRQALPLLACNFPAGRQNIYCRILSAANAVIFSLIGAAADAGMYPGGAADADYGRRDLNLSSHTVTS